MILLPLIRHITSFAPCLNTFRSITMPHSQSMLELSENEKKTNNSREGSFVHVGTDYTIITNSMHLRYCESGFYLDSAGYHSLRPNVVIE
jgi:predicted nuclease of restriction endonuclease-like (RecB) superfamily